MDHYLTLPLKSIEHEPLLAQHFILNRRTILQDNKDIGQVLVK